MSQHAFNLSMLPMALILLTEHMRLKLKKQKKRKDNLI